MTSGRARIIDRCTELFEDVSLGAVKEWKEGGPGRKAIGHLPVYAPREIVHAAGMLPVGVSGGGDRVDIVRGDAYVQSYICHLPRSVLELGLGGKLDALDGMLFPATCDVIRNLSGMWQLLFPTKYARYLDLPQNMDPAVAQPFWRGELAALRDGLAALAGTPPASDATIAESLAAYRAARRLVDRLDELRMAKPHVVPLVELYLVLRAGDVLPVEAHAQLLADYLRSAEQSEAVPMDNARVVVVGAFCEQPPLGLLRALEKAGLYVVDDDLTLTHRWFRTGGAGRVNGAASADPLGWLAGAYLTQSVTTAPRYEPDGRRGERLLERVREVMADGVVFCAPSFCDPALLDRPLLTGALERAGVPAIFIQYAENAGDLHAIREQAGTFSDSIKLWSQP